MRPSVALLTLTLISAGACGEIVEAPRVRGFVSLALAVQWPDTPLPTAVFGADIDTVDVVVWRPDESVAVQQVLPFPAREEGLRFALDVPLRQKVETLYVYLELRAAGSTLYYSNAQVILREGSVPAVPTLPLTYIGPGYDAVSLIITPRDQTIIRGDSIQFSAVAQNALQGAVGAPVAWSVSNGTLGSIDATGRFRSKLSTGTLRIHAFTPTGIRDSVTVTLSTALP